MPNEVALVSIDAPVTPATPGSNPVTVTIRNGGTAVLNSVTISYALNGGTPVTQTFTMLNLAAGATRQLTFTTGVVAPSGTNSLTVTVSLPNGQPDPNSTNNALTVSFEQPTPANDEPCAAVTLTSGGSLSSSTSGASTSTQPGINLPACSPAGAPKDVWFTLTPAGTSTTLTLTGSTAGMVRLFESPDCANGPFNQVFCASSGASNTGFSAPVTVTGLTANRRYYLAVSGFGSSDTGGTFTVAGTNLLASRLRAESAALTVYPNPSATGQLSVRLGTAHPAGQLTLLNALGQTVRQQAVAAGTATEQTLSTRNLAAGVYTLRVAVGSDVLTRKIVLE